MDHLTTATYCPCCGAEKREWNERALTAEDYRTIGKAVVLALTQLRNDRRRDK